MLQKSPLNGFKWDEEISQFKKDLTENCNKDSDEGYFLEVDVRYSEELHDLHIDLPERIKNEKVEKLVANLHDKYQKHKKFKTSNKSWIFSHESCIEKTA